MRDVFFILMAGLTTIVIQTTFAGFFWGSEYKPDLMLVLVSWAGFRMQFLVGVALAFCGGLILDLFSGSPSGLFSLMYCFLLLAFGYADSRFHVDSNSAKAVMIFAASLIVGGMVFIMRRVASPVELGWNVGQWIIIKSGITAMTSLVILPALDSLWSGYTRLVGIR
ncbi:MAG: rod shape-determining protein MreD [Desulfomonile tiedjei]|uniref:Rod shape-determining protein MreD n=1 Tax=Desulfomonile tiedjei TaxID=2358 RepID=A0A9D6UYZ9_9BACT|nr:rod shape-determining protein MreD [Desulfomonile tiedjei]